MKINYFFIDTINVVTLIVIAIFFGSCDPITDKDPPEDTGAKKTAEDRRITINKMDAQLVKINTIYISINEAFKHTGPGYGSGYADIAEHASEIEDLAQEILDAAVILYSSEYDLIKTRFIEIQHATHELEHAAEQKKHHDTHHSAETLRRHIDYLEKDIQKLR